MTVKIGIIGGSGLSKMGIIENIEEVTVETPFGKPSDAISLGTIKGVQVAFLPRHGRHHSIAPHMVNNQANIFALKNAGVEYVVSLAAVGSLKKHMKPGDFVIVQQLIDRTAKRRTTFFEQGIVAHVGFADPVCPLLSDLAFKYVKKEGIDVHRGTYLCMEGPQFSTRAESQLYRSWNVDIIGMTLAPEAKLAREAGMCLCSICAISDYDCWHDEEDDVCVSSLVETLKKNSVHTANLLTHLVPAITYKRTCDCKTALQQAIITSPDLVKNPSNPIDREVLRKLLK